MSERISSKVEETINRVFGGHSPKREEILHLLIIDPHSLDAGFIMASANTLSRRVSQGRAEIHAQIGLNLSPPGSSLEKFGMISEYRRAFLVAVVRLAMGRKLVGNCTHEPNLLGAAAGANLFWAEAGANPRDTETETSKGRGWSVSSCIRLFREADFDVLKGPSAIYGQNAKKRW